MSMRWLEDNLLVPGEEVRYQTHGGGWQYTITSRRLIGVKQKMFGHDITEMNLATIDYVDAQKGGWGSGGKITITSASGNRDLEIPHIPNVLEFRRELLAAADDLMFG